MQGLAWDARGRLWASEFGQNTWDELNRIVPGGNYGWPVVEGRSGDDRFRNPVRQWHTDVASPSGIAIAGGVGVHGRLRGERLWQIPLLGGTGPGKPRALLTQPLRPAARRRGGAGRVAVGHDQQHRRPRLAATGRRPDRPPDAVVVDDGRHGDPPPGPVALVGSGEYLPVMEDVERRLIAGRPPRFVQLADGGRARGPRLAGALARAGPGLGRTARV